MEFEPEGNQPVRDPTRISESTFPGGFLILKDRILPSRNRFVVPSKFVALDPFRYSLALPKRDERFGQHGTCFENNGSVGFSLLVNPT